MSREIRHAPPPMARDAQVQVVADPRCVAGHLWSYGLRIRECRRCPAVER